MTNLTAQFKTYLIANKLSSVSVKNYVSDVNKFLDWLNSGRDAIYGVSTKGDASLPTQNDFQNYYNKLAQNNTPSQTLKRYQSSLRKFGQFLQDEYLLPKNPAKLSRDAIYGVSTQQIDLEKMLDAYRKSLEKSGSKPATVKNYMADTKQFLDWLAACNF